MRGGLPDFQGTQNSHEVSHGTRCILYSLTVTNQCPWCMSTFANRLTAQHHVESAFRNARCLVDHSPHGHEVVEPESVECPECDPGAGEYETLAQLQLHIRSHAPVEAPSLVFTVAPEQQQRRPEGHVMEAEGWRGPVPDWLARRRARLAQGQEGQGQGR